MNAHGCKKPAPRNRKRTRAEVLIQREIELALGAERDLVLLRNSQGKAQYVTDDGKEYFVPYGLGEGTPDLVGILRVELLAARPPNRFIPLGVWFCLEVKAPGELATPEQVVAHEAWRRMGAIVETVDSVDAARAALERAREACR